LPQPTSNPNQTLTQNQLFLPKVMEDDVAAPCSLLLFFLKKKQKTIKNKRK